MADSNSIVFVGVAPHPPIMVPEVGREAIAEVRGSIDAMRELTERVLASGAETLVLVSPHAPLDPRAFVAYAEPELYGDFANFRAPDATVSAPLDVELLGAIEETAAADGYRLLRLPSGYELDHGTAVPLYFFLHNGWRGRVVALGYSFLSNEDHVRFGACIRRAAGRLNRSVAFIASGDLSHRLKPGAPAGYYPNAYLFDEEIVAAVRAAAPERIVNIDQDLRRRAGECGYRSLLVAIGAAAGGGSGRRGLALRSPFRRRLHGGAACADYEDAMMKAKLDRDRTAPAAQTDAAEAVEDTLDYADLPRLARRTVETYVREGRVIEPPDISAESSLQHPAACFVSIKTEQGDLRGCIGTIEPTYPSLAEELIANAISAATRDPRFLPITPAELLHLRFSVDVLSAPEPAQLEDLDPSTYGVIVTDESGRQRGLLLPAIEGVETIGQQVAIAARKAGLRPDTALKLYRFRVKRFNEQSATA